VICLRDCLVALSARGLCIARGFPALAWISNNGDGTFTNPVLYADYPDPDISRGGDDFYFATTTLVSTPGLTILHSQDLVNWEIVSHVIPRLEGRPQYDLNGGSAYRSGIFAPSLRYYHGSFYVVTTPVGGPDLYLRTELDFVQNQGICSYSIDEAHWTELGGRFDLAFDWRTGTFQGEQFAIFCFNPRPGSGFVDVDWFRFTDTRSKE
jgi:Glycosyl hydrolases family 43/Beta xylosidase C-terminal Concanavalin A-like domain